MSKELINTTLSKDIKFSVKIIDIRKDVPEKEISNFKHWVLEKGIELGIGKHFEYYSYSENYLEDIPCIFETFYNNI